VERMGGKRNKQRDIAWKMGAEERELEEEKDE